MKPPIDFRHATIALVVLLLVAPATLWAQSRGKSSSGSQVRSSKTSSGQTGRYRAFGRHRGGTQAPPRAQPYLQPSNSGIRPEGFGSHRGGVHQPVIHVPVHHHHVPVFFAGSFSSSVAGGFRQEPAQQPVIVVQAPPPPPPIVVMVPQPQPQPAPTAPSASPVPAALTPPAPREPGSIRFTIVPADAQVLLDDRPLGMAGELIGAAGIRVSAGVHVLEILHPARTDERLIFGVGSDDEVHVEIDLDETRPSRRTRLTSRGSSG